MKREFLCIVASLGAFACSDAERATDGGVKADASEFAMSDAGPIDGGTTLDCTPPCFAFTRLLSGPSDFDEIDAVAAAPNGDVYIAGRFQQTLRIDGDPQERTSDGEDDIMVVAYSRDGTWLWTRHFGGPWRDNVFDADVDDDGFLYLSGYFGATLRFDGGAGPCLAAERGTQCIETDNPEDAEDLDMMVIKLDPRRAGDVVWARRAGGFSADGGNEIEVGPDGRLFVLAQSEGDFTAGGLTFINEGRTNAYLLSMDPSDGRFLWGVHAAASVIARSKCLGVDAGGNILFGGDYNGSMALVGTDGNRQPMTPVTGMTNADGFVSSWTVNGTHRWSHDFGGDALDLCKAAVGTADRGAYVVGYFQGDVEFEAASESATGMSLQSQGRDLFAWRLDADGGTRWLRRITSSSNLLGAEAILGPDDGLIFGFRMPADVRLQGGPGLDMQVELPIPNTEWPLLIRYSPEGDPTMALLPEQAAEANLDEMSRVGRRLYMDVPVFDGRYQFGDDQREVTGGKDALLVAVDL